MKKIFSSILFLSIFVTSVFAQTSEPGAENSPIENLQSKMHLVSGGNFFMGADNQEANENPVHDVSLDSFYISETEINQHEYFSVMGENLSYFKNENLPVEEVSWYDAVIFCNKLSIMAGLEPAYSLDGKTNPDEWGKIPRLDSDSSEISRWNKIAWNENADGYRLPTEAEWEYASRGAAFENGFPYSGFQDMDSAGWTKANSGEKSHECASKEANQLGLFDMSGNVWEWCWDWYGRYADEARLNPSGAEEKTSRRRVRKGGSFKSDEKYCRSSNRASTSPEIRGRDLGFRIARSADCGRTFSLRENDVTLDTEKFPYSILISSYRDEKSALNEKNRLAEKGIKSYVLKKYLDQDVPLQFDLHAGYFSSLDDAKAVQNQLKDLGMKYVSVEKFSNAHNDFDSFIKKNCISYDEKTFDGENIFNPSIKSCLEIMPANVGYQIEYLELADFDAIKSNHGTLNGLMLEDFFPDSNESIHAAIYSEYNDSIFNRSLIVIAAQSEEGHFSTKAETFASSFMDGVYEEGNFSMQIGNITCTVVKAYGQLVACGNSQDGSLYMLMFARGFSVDDLNDFVKTSFDGNISSYAQVGKILYAYPDSSENSNRDFLKFTLAKNNDFTGEDDSSQGMWYGEGTFIQDGKEIDAAILQMEYHQQAQNWFRNHKTEVEAQDVSVNGSVPGIFVTNSEGTFLLFPSGSYIVILHSSEQKNYEDFEGFAKPMKVWR